MGYNFNIPRGEIHQEVKIMFNFFKACSFGQLCEMLRAICGGYGC